MIQFNLLYGLWLRGRICPRECRRRRSSSGIQIVKTETKRANNKGKSTFDKDRRRKHHHYLVTVFYADGEKFGRVYTDKDKATRFADRQRRSPVVKMARVSQVS